MWAAREEKNNGNSVREFVIVNSLDIKGRSDLAHHVKESALRANATLSVVFAHVGLNWTAVRSSVSWRSLWWSRVVSVLYGHSSHRIQGVELINGKPVLYGAGPFIDDYAVDS